MLLLLLFTILFYHPHHPYYHDHHSKHPYPHPHYHHQHHHPLIIENLVRKTGRNWLLGEGFCLSASVLGSLQPSYYQTTLLPSEEPKACKQNLNLLDTMPRVPFGFFHGGSSLSAIALCCLSKYIHSNCSVRKTPEELSIKGIR